MKKYTFLIIFIMISYHECYCRIAPSVDYKYFNKTNDLLVSLDFKSSLNLEHFGIADELTLLKLSAGKRFVNGNNSTIYNFGLLSYQSLIRVPIIKCKTDDTNCLDQEFVLQNDYSTFLTFSYQGLLLTNSGIYTKDYNWSSVGFDILFKSFKKNYFYTKLSILASANTIENNKTYFEGIDTSFKSDFCFSTKVSSLSKILIGNFSKLRLEAYYRSFYNYLNQKEISLNSGYEFKLLNFIVNPKIGYTTFGSNNNWKGFCFINLGLTYVIVINNTIY